MLKIQPDNDAAKWLKHNPLACDIWEQKYRYNGESFEQFVNRVSGGDIAIAKMILSQEFLPGGRIMSNRGTPRRDSMSNCYSHGFILDDFIDIMQANTNIALTYRAQGGQGLSLSKLRPRGTGIGNRYTSDGIVPFIEMYNATTSAVSQGGSRKGALLISLDIRHKEAETFITLKANADRVNLANLSLEIDDEFMSAVERYYLNNEVVVLHESREYAGHIVEYDITPINLYKLMVQTAYDWGEPGCIFTERFRNYNLLQFDPDYEIETCNPCGEQPLKKHTSCNLASLNLAAFVKNPFTYEAEFDMWRFKNAVAAGIRFLDDIIDENLERHPLKEQRDNTAAYRNCGLGTFGLAGCLMKMGLVYGSMDSIEFIDTVYEAMFRAAVTASNKLAKERGTYPAYKECVWDSTIMKRNFSAAEIASMRDNGLRNCSLLSIAPNGSTALLFGESSGIEPEFAIKYFRTTKSLNGEQESKYPVYCKTATEFLRRYPDSGLSEVFVCASDIKWIDRLKVQAHLQDHIDTAISSTINLPHDIPIAEVEQIYLSAWKLRLKGITLFRDKCKRVGILNTDEPSATDASIKYEVLPRGYIMDVPDGLTYRKYRLQTGCGRLYLFVGIDESEGVIYDCFTNTDGQGGCAINTQANSRLLSACMRGGVPIEYIISQLIKAGTCPSFQYARGAGKELCKGKSCASAIAYILSDIVEELKIEVEAENDVSIVDEVQHKQTQCCPECGAEGIAYESGCVSCHSCGWSKCG